MAYLRELLGADVIKAILFYITDSVIHSVGGLKMLFVSALGNDRVGVVAYQMRDQKIRVALDGENVSMIFILIFFENSENGIVYKFVLYKMLEGVVPLLEEKWRQIQAKKVTFARDPLVKLVSVYDYAVAFFGGYYPLAAPDGKIAAA